MSTAQLDGHATGGHATGLGATTRKDNWWVEPLLYAVGLLAFVVYSAWAGTQGKYYYADPYLSPMYAPVLYTDSSQPGSVPADHAWFGEKPGWWPTFLPFSPAFLILAFPGSFRVTCYYYRKAYYRSLFLRPPACAVTARQAGWYNGETRFALWQNLHRYTLIFALGGLIFIFMNVLAAAAGVAIASTAMATAVMVLEVFVAFLQAFIFAMLTSVFIGLIRHAH